MKYRRQWIKYLILLVFLLISIYLNNYRIRYHWFDKDFTEIVHLPPDTSEVKVDSVLLKPAVSPVKKKWEKVPLEKERTLPHVMQAPVLEFTAEMNIWSLDNLQQEMNALAEKNKMGLKTVYRFHISPVEYKAKAIDFVVPVGMIAVGAIASQTSGYRDFIPVNRPKGERVVTHFDDVLQYMVPAGVFVFDVIAKEKHHPVDQFFLMAISSGLTALQVRSLKSYLKEERPDGGTNSFPSGHTAVAFMGARMIHKEFKDSDPLITYSGYAMAGAVGALRMVNNKHWGSDVLAGAGFAILSTELAYWLYFPVRNLITDKLNGVFDHYFIVTPMLHPDAIGFRANMNF